MLESTYKKIIWYSLVNSGFHYEFYERNEYCQLMRLILSLKAIFQIKFTALLQIESQINFPIFMFATHPW